jgi:hypothetical protein
MRATDPAAPARRTILARWRGPVASGKIDRFRVLRLVEPELLAARQGDVSETAPALLLDRRRLHALRVQIRDGGVDVVAHQIQLVTLPLLRRMDGDFRRRRLEDQPSAPGVNRRPAEDVSKERPRRVVFRRVHDRVHSSDGHVSPHLFRLTTEATRPGYRISPIGYRISDIRTPRAAPTPARARTRWTGGRARWRPDRRTCRYSAYWSTRGRRTPRGRTSTGCSRAPCCSGGP